ncbi:D-aminoacyl-tRNA deacylase [Planctomycetota bacterium]
MRAVVQRVTNATVQVNHETVGKIEQGLLVYLGVQQGDTEQDAQFLADKLAYLRIFNDDANKMNRSVQDVNGAILLVSQFTLCGDCRKGRRPGFDLAADPNDAERLYEIVGQLLTDTGIPVQTGVFRASMQVSSTNDGPVTFLLDSRKLF